MGYLFLDVGSLVGVSSAIGGNLGRVGSSPSAGRQSRRRLFDVGQPQRHHCNHSKVSSSIAKEAQVHDHIMEDGVMKMTQLIGLEVGAGESIKMKPHGKHLMLFGLKEPLKDGGTFSMRIEFKEIDPVEFEVPIKKH